MRFRRSAHRSSADVVVAYEADCLNPHRHAGWSVVVTGRDSAPAPGMATTINEVSRNAIVMTCTVPFCGRPVKTSVAQGRVSAQPAQRDPAVFSSGQKTSLHDTPRNARATPCYGPKPVSLIQTFGIDHFSSHANRLWSAALAS